jgi:endonuclease YncB( thermonuclease family)
MTRTGCRPVPPKTKNSGAAELAAPGSFTYLLPFFLFLLFTLFPFLLFSSSSFAATVAAVIDGDTIMLTDGTRVRYLGVNTPEHGQPFYEEAKQYNERLVLHKEIRLAGNKPERDVFGRVLAYVYAGDVLVNARLIAEGLGHLFVLGSLERYEEWLRLQKDAQRQHKGMWRLGGVPGPLLITTVHADAEGGDRRNPNGEYVRVCNVSDSSVELRGFQIQDAADHRYVFPEGTLDPGYTALLLSGKGQDMTRRGQLLFHRGDGPIWNNDGDTASLFDPSGKLIDSFRVQGEVSE